MKKSLIILVLSLYAPCLFGARPAPRSILSDIKNNGDEPVMVMIIDEPTRRETMRKAGVIEPNQESPFKNMEIPLSDATLPYERAIWIGTKQGIFSVFEQAGEIRLEPSVLTSPIKGYSVIVGKQGSALTIVVDMQGAVSIQK